MAVLFTQPGSAADVGDVRTECPLHFYQTDGALPVRAGTCSPVHDPGTSALAADQTLAAVTLRAHTAVYRPFGAVQVEGIQRGSSSGDELARGKG